MPVSWLRIAYIPGTVLLGGPVEGGVADSSVSVDLHVGFSSGMVHLLAT
jgi:hypothetical protein